MAQHIRLAPARERLQVPPVRGVEEAQIVVQQAIQLVARGEAPAREGKPHKGVAAA